MKKIIFALFCLISHNVLAADEFWINPQWGTPKIDLDKKYKLIDLSIQNLDKHIAYFFDNYDAKRFATYLVDNKKYNYGGQEFNVVAGFYENKLQWVMIATDELDDTKENEELVIKKCPQIFTVNDKIKLFSAKLNVLKEFSIIGYELIDDTYFETQSPLNKGFQQFTLYRMNHNFFRTLRIKMNLDPIKYKEQVITCLMPELVNNDKKLLIKSEEKQK